MRCPNCGSENVRVQVINEVHMESHGYGCLWWLLIGWWWIPIKWIFFTIPALIFKIFGHKKQVAVNTQKVVCVCQNCGYSYKTN